jgi:hypothetical protein
MYYLLSKKLLQNKVFNLDKRYFVAFIELIWLWFPSTFRFFVFRLSYSWDYRKQEKRKYLKKSQKLNIQEEKPKDNTT